jgi:hypothetical protein
MINSNLITNQKLFELNSNLITNQKLFEHVIWQINILIFERDKNNMQNIIT